VAISPPGEGDKMDSNAKVRIVVALVGEISEESKEMIINTLRKNLKNYSGLPVQVEAEVVG
jgi:hypothetical protein